MFLSVFQKYLANLIFVAYSAKDSLHDKFNLMS